MDCFRLIIERHIVGQLVKRFSIGQKLVGRFFKRFNIGQKLVGRFVKRLIEQQRLIFRRLVITDRKAERQIIKCYRVSACHGRRGSVR